MKSLPFLQRLVAGPSTGTSRFDFRLVHVRYVVDKWGWDKFFSEYFRFLLSVSFHLCSMLIFIDMLLLREGQTGETWEPSGKEVLFQVGQHSTVKQFHYFRHI